MDGHIQSSTGATILAFPTGGRKAVARRLAMEAIENDNRPVPHIEYGAWYHDAAMAEEPKRN